MATNTTTNALNLLPRAAGVLITTANPNRDGTGTLGTAISATGNGARIELFRIVAAGAVTDGMIRLFYVDLAGGKFLLSEIAVAATTPSATDPVWQYTHIPAVLLVLPPGSSIQVGTERAETFHVTAIGWSI